MRNGHRHVGAPCQEGEIHGGLTRMSRLYTSVQSISYQVNVDQHKSWFILMYICLYSYFHYGNRLSIDKRLLCSRRACYVQSLGTSVFTMTFNNMLLLSSSHGVHFRRFSPPKGLLIDAVSGRTALELREDIESC